MRGSAGALLWCRLLSPPTQQNAPHQPSYPHHQPSKTPTKTSQYASNQHPNPNPSHSNYQPRETESEPQNYPHHPPQQQQQHHANHTPYHHTKPDHEAPQHPHQASQQQQTHPHSYPSTQNQTPQSPAPPEQPSHQIATHHHQSLQSAGRYRCYWPAGWRPGGAAEQRGLLPHRWHPVQQKLRRAPPKRWREQQLRRK